MSELLPYEKQLAGKLADLPLPEEDKGWEAMRKMLEEDDDDGGIIPPVNRGCRTWGAILLLVALVAGIIALTWKKHAVNQTDAPYNPATLKDSSLAGKHPVITDTGTMATGTLKGGTTTDSTGQTYTRTQPAGSVATTVQQSVRKNAALAQVDKSVAIKVGRKQALQTDDNAGKTGNTTPPVKSVEGRVIPPETSPGVAPGTAPNQFPRNQTTAVPINSYTKRPGTDTVTQKDTSGKPVVPLTGAPTNNGDNKKKGKGDSDDDSKIWFGAGLALQQLVPVDGQKAVPYSSSGRKGSLGDYIPSAYFRVYHKRKFLQVEFKYGAPQYTKDVAYQKTVISSDSSSGISVANVNHVKKTYYHQLPVSIHYSPLPNLSLGLGVVWNKFQSAVVEQETRSFRGNVIVDSSGAAIPTKLLTVKGDSATSFSKSYLQFMLEAQYTWRRFSLGARYAFGLQPYLTFTSPTTGQQQKERNASLSIFIRYELWRSKKK